MWIAWLFAPFQGASSYHRLCRWSFIRHSFGLVAHVRAVGQGEHDVALRFLGLADLEIDRDLVQVKRGILPHGLESKKVDVLGDRVDLRPRPVHRQVGVPIALDGENVRTPFNGRGLAIEGITISVDLEAGNGRQKLHSVRHSSFVIHSSLGISSFVISIQGGCTRTLGTRRRIDD